MPFLTPIAYSERSVTDVFQFVKEIQQRTDSIRTLMVSLDIESLFTNVPVAETIDIILLDFSLMSLVNIVGLLEMILKRYLN